MLANQDPLSGSAPSLLQLSAEIAGSFSLSVSLGPSALLGGALIATEVMKWLLGIPVGWLDGNVVVYNLITASWTTHKVISLPWCEYCGGAKALVSAQSQGSGPNLSECATVDAVKKNFLGWIDSRVGVISDFYLRGSDDGMLPPPFFVRAVLAYQTNGQKLTGPADHCGGKGYIEADAVLSALGESLERYSAAVVPREGLHLATIGELPGGAIDPRELCLYTEEQYRRPTFPYARFDPDRSHSWIKGWWIHNGEEVWVPAATAFYSRIEKDGPSYCQTTSSGLAAGRTFEDAAVRATYELLERDALMITWAARRPGRRVRLDTTIEPEVLTTVNKLSELGAEVEVYILDVDSPVTTAACFAFGDGITWPGLTLGSAAHLDPQVAVRNAILEQAYSGLAYRRMMMAPRGFKIPEEEEVRTFLQHGLYYIPRERKRAANFLRDSPVVSLRDCCGASSVSPDCPRSSVWGDLASALNKSGLRIAVVDVTAPDVCLTGFKIARALGPNIQPLWCGFGMERAPCTRALKLMVSRPNQNLHPVC
jgi:ribosomal protein S12 methylthiotransferase accessory factor